MAMMEIGPDLKESAGPVAEAIISIINVEADQQTIQKALEVFGSVVRVENITVSNSRFLDKRVVIDQGEEE